MAQDTLRSFLAIEVSEALKSETHHFVETIRSKYTDFRFIPSQNWHLTLHFLGQVETEKIEILAACTSKALENVRPFSISLERFGTFPNWHQPRILWIGIGGDLPQLSALKEQLDQVLRKMHFHIETRSYHPHITIARFKGGTPRLRSEPEEQFKSRLVDSVHYITLFRSDLSPQGAQHIPLRTFLLGGS